MTGDRGPGRPAALTASLFLAAIFAVLIAGPHLASSGGGGASLDLPPAELSPAVVSAHHGAAATPAPATRAPTEAPVPPPSREASPVIVFGMGGSGTRGASQLLASAGVYLGEREVWNGRPRDLKSFIPEIAVFKALLPELRRRRIGVGGWRHSEDLSADVAALLDAALREGVGRRYEPLALQRLHASSSADKASEVGLRRWGWKAPRNMLLLPLLLARYPEAQFVHVLRDPLDYAAHPDSFGQSASWLDLLCPFFGAERCAPCADGGQRSDACSHLDAALWANATAEALGWGRRLNARERQQRRPPRYLVVREDNDVVLAEEADIELELRRVRRFLYGAGAEGEGAEAALGRMRETVEKERTQSTSYQKWRAGEASFSKEQLRKMRIWLDETGETARKLCNYSYPSAFLVAEDGGGGAGL